MKITWSEIKHFSKRVDFIVNCNFSFSWKCVFDYCFFLVSHKNALQSWKHWLKVENYYHFFHVDMNGSWIFFGTHLSFPRRVDDEYVEIFWQKESGLALFHYFLGPISKLFEFRSCRLCIYFLENANFQCNLRFSLINRSH